MDAYAVPARRGDFLYHGELYVDPGNTKHYKRASATDLDKLLKPPKSSTKPAKDETAAFYEAQLVHYGLQRTKDKSRAKLRLLDAVHAGSLKAPKDVKKTEAELKKQYTTQNKKPKTEPRDPAPTDKPKKRKREDDDVAATRPGSKPRTKQTAEPSSARGGGTRGGSRGRARGGSKAAAASSRPAPPKSEQPSPSAAPREKQTARRSRPFPRASTSSRGQKQTARRYIGGRAPRKAAGSRAGASGPDVTLTGFWEVSCETIEEEWAGECSLQLKLDGDENYWGRFGFGAFEGIIRGKVNRVSLTQVESDFRWRGRETGMGMILTGRGQCGSIEFDADGTLEGNIEGLYGDSVEFTASLEGPCDWDEWRFQSRWDSLSEEEYERERVNRWK